MTQGKGGRGRRGWRFERKGGIESGCGRGGGRCLGEWEKEGEGEEVTMDNAL